MNVRDCYSELGLHYGADLEAVKSAYRKMAFELHPDLNQSPGAADHFTRVNEAYVILRDVLKDEPQGKPSSRKSKKADAGKASTNAGEGAKRYRSHFGGFGQGTGSGDKAQFGGPKFHYKKEEVIRNILNDPFARKVFEDIYDRAKEKGLAPDEPVDLESRRLTMRWGDRALDVNLTGNAVGGLKSWMKHQMDDETEIKVKASSLTPGTILRLKLRRPFSGKPMSVEVPLPADYVPGRSLRLKGLGRKIGPFKGDLYVKLLPE